MACQGFENYFCTCQLLKWVLRTLILGGWNCSKNKTENKITLFILHTKAVTDATY